MGEFNGLTWLCKKSYPSRRSQIQSWQQMLGVSCQESTTKRTLCGCCKAADSQPDLRRLGKFDSCLESTDRGFNVETDFKFSTEAKSFRHLPNGEKRYFRLKTKLSSPLTFSFRRCLPCGKLHTKEKQRFLTLISSTESGTDSDNKLRQCRSKTFPRYCWHPTRSAEQQF